MAVNAHLTHSTSASPIQTSEFFITDLRMFSRFVGNNPIYGHGCSSAIEIEEVRRDKMSEKWRK
jgi:hypothetical protein